MVSHATRIVTPLQH